MEMKSTTNSLKAIIIDDEKDLCFLLQKILEHQSIQSFSVNTLKEADAALSRVKPGIIFLDNHLPDGSGVEEIYKMKKKYPRSRIVMMTAFNVDNVKKKAIYNGADGFLTKPFSKSMIEETLIKLNLKAAG